MSWANDDILGPLYGQQPYQLFSRAASKSSTPTTTPTTPSFEKPHKEAPEKLSVQISSVEHTNSTSSTPESKRRRVSLRSIKKGIQKAYTSTRARISSMSERPLDSIKRASKKADKAPHLRKKNFTGMDTIDVLDETGFGGAYHHDGPYDATLASRNRNKRYAPVEAVKYGNQEALKATPRENVVDSLERHVPLQGTATIPPGSPDYGGRIMNYEEGADLMREEDAPGGPYKRWDNIKYHPNDLKGKGEPSYTIEEDLKKQKRARKPLDHTGTYEMQPTSARTSGRNDKDGNNVVVRQRSASLNSAGPSSPKSKRLSDGIKRRIGSIRRKHDDP